MITKSCCLIGALLLAGCASPNKQFEGRLGVQQQGPQEYMYVQASGKKMGYSALELDQIARAYVWEQKIPFELQGAERNIWIQTDGSPIIAKVYFSAGPTQPLLQVDIDRDGKVRRHQITPGKG